MTKTQLTKAMTQLGITQSALASLAKANERTVRRWMKGDWPVPRPVALLLNLMLDTKSTMEDLRG
jgi:transcriptional regulator with XRE-family HTH domain